MDKRYQVFVSSTYQDLQEERQEVMHALLELDCIPSGMELFPAADEAQWSLIKKVIDDCDYYIVIIGARYGTPGPEGISYTEMEYRYATEKRKPTLAFLHKDPGSIPRDKTDGNDEKWQKLGAFRNLAQEKMCKYWTSPADLGGVVSRSLVQLKKTTSAVGWVRANELADPEVYAENTRLRKKIEELEADLATLAMRGPENVEKLAQGEEKYMLEFNVIYFDVMYIDGGYCPSYETVLIPLTWNEIMAAVLPLFQVGGSAIEVKPVLESLIVRLIDRTNLREVYADLDQFRISVYNGEICVVLSTKSLNTVIVQLRALGMINSSTKERNPTDSNIYWTLTPFGDTTMVRLCAIRSSK